MKFSPHRAAGISSAVPAFRPLRSWLSVPMIPAISPRTSSRAGLPGTKNHADSLLLVISAAFLPAPRLIWILAPTASPHFFCSPLTWPNSTLTPMQSSTSRFRIPASRTIWPDVFLSRMALPHHFGFGGEIWHFTQPFQNGHAAGFLFAPTYTPRPNLVFDAGFNRGLTSTSTRWEFFMGFTYLLPKKFL